MTSSLPLQIAETIQTASLNRTPFPAYDINPSTAASNKEPVRIASPFQAPPSDPYRRSDSLHPPGFLRSPRSQSSPPPYSTVRSNPRKAALPPLPDLRFEQSYLASLQGVQGWQGVTYITVRDQILLPLIQGTLWTLALSGWRHWNKTATYSGRSVGARVRRWWWRVNNWTVPRQSVDGVGWGAGGHAGGWERGGGMENERMVEDMREFVHGQMGVGGD